VHIFVEKCAQFLRDGKFKSGAELARDRVRRGGEKERATGLAGAALDDEVHAALLRALFEGRLTPGAKLPEHRLAKLFGVSRERIRKVLHRLVAERRLEAIPQRGVFAPNPSAEEIRSVYRAHRVFEAGVLAELARSRASAVAERIDAHLIEEREAAERGNRPLSVRLSGEFHTLLVDALDSAELSRFIRELLARSSLMVSAFEPARLSLCGVDEHAAIAAALKDGDVGRAVALSGEHFHHIEERLAQGIGERSERDIESALMPLVDELARPRTAKRRLSKPRERAKGPDEASAPPLRPLA
jgi:DNA-binding GntR family transcriptional regulator